MIETYSIWNLHGEQVDHASSSNATRVGNVEPIVDPNDQVMDIIQDAFPFASTNINQERQDDVPTPIDSAEFEQYEKLLKNVNQELYPGCESFSVLMAIVELMHGKIKYHDDVMRHPANGEAWKEFDRTFPEFAADPRNVRLGLAIDGFNPYGVLNQHHSTWPIFVFPFNFAALEMHEKRIHDDDCFDN
ncbi:hypothetical protein L3X38_033993 [Prunus dulcis]|uniref:Uncharacterized protein n=1 Tax=Prunus dulcis TaxID=3755 RepID=A0AAD4VH23_PRUDU|nr:hypothetical protein L3X38_033993 [Prunus dulcis]